MTAMAMDSTHHQPGQQRSRLIRAIVATCVVAIAGLLGYWAGSASRVEELTGVAHVGDEIFTAEIGDWSYGASDSVAWIDRDGTWHDSGWPSCLGTPGSAPVTFGATQVSGPTSVSWREVVWVDCR